MKEEKLTSKGKKRVGKKTDTKTLSQSVDEDNCNLLGNTEQNQKMHFYPQTQGPFR